MITTIEQFFQILTNNEKYLQKLKRGKCEDTLQDLLLRIAEDIVKKGKLFNDETHVLKYINAGFQKEILQKIRNEKGINTKKEKYKEHLLNNPAATEDETEVFENRFKQTKNLYEEIIRFVDANYNSADRVLFIKHVIYKTTFAELAKETGYSITHCYTRVNNIRIALKKKFTEEEIIKLYA